MFVANGTNQHRHVAANDAELLSAMSKNECLIIPRNNTVRPYIVCACLLSQYSTVVLTVVRVMVAKYRKSGISGYRSSLTPEPVELK